jgi:hypothetical protein
MLRDLLNSTAMNVFLGTLPLTGSILWGLLQNDRRFIALDQRLSRIETKLDGMDAKLSNVSERLVKVETKLEGGHVVLAR